MLTAIFTILIFLVLISLHEFGHFIMAKASGVTVHEFSIGMGPAIFKKQGKETLYSVRIFPVGGYCKLEGEDSESDNPRAFCNQKWWKRFLVISAGAILNLILGFVLVVVMVLVQPHQKGEPNVITTPVVKEIVKGSYMEDAGILPGDKIVSINGNKVHIYNDISLYTSKLEVDEYVEIGIKRGDKKFNFELKPSLSETTYNYGENSVEIITKINDTEERAVYEYTENDRDIIADVIGESATDKKLILGFMADTEEVSAFNILPYSYNYTGFVVRMVYRSLWDMVTGKVGFREVSGPVGIIDAVNTAVNTGEYMAVNLLSLTALLSINLGIFNLLPLPALDGGRLFFMLIELIRRKKIPPEKEGMVHAIGLMLLLLLSVVIFYNDIIKIIAK